MAKTDAAAAAQKWSGNLAASTPAIQAGVEAVQVAPGKLAAAQQQAWLQRLTASAPKWARNVAAVSLDSWKTDMLGKGLQRIASGATAAEPKMQAFFGELLPYTAKVSAAVRAMPKGNLQQSIARMTKNVQMMAQFQKGGGPNQTPQG